MEVTVMGVPQKEAALDALGSPVRRTILRILAPGPLPVGQIAAGLPVSRPAVSKHLRILERVNLVTHEKQGSRNLFRLDVQGFDLARDAIESFWEGSLARFALVAGNTAPRRKSK
jgi:DNA-binding transcriptional ArsR family regulator